MIIQNESATWAELLRLQAGTEKGQMVVSGQDVQLLSCGDDPHVNHKWTVERRRPLLTKVGTLDTVGRTHNTFEDHSMLESEWVSTDIWADNQLYQVRVNRSAHPVCNMEPQFHPVTVVNPASILADSPVVKLLYWPAEGAICVLYKLERMLHLATLYRHRVRMGGPSKCNVESR